MSEEMKDPKEIAKHLIEIAGKKKTIARKGTFGRRFGKGIRWLWRDSVFFRRG